MKTRIVVEGEDAVYHVTSRMAYQLLKMNAKEKNTFKQLMKKQAIFSGVEVLTFCLLKNHFHILIRIPHNEKISDEELYKRYNALYEDSQLPHILKPESVKEILQNGGPKAETLRNQLTARMGSLSIFMKELKQRFSIWFNREHNNVGTLWSMRFQSILVENTTKVLEIVGAYIDSNPVRLNLCQKPEDYPHSGFADACRGKLEAKSGLRALYGNSTWQSAMKRYQKVLSDPESQLTHCSSGLHSLQTGIIGQQGFTQKWNAKRRPNQSTAQKAGISLLGGILYAAGCALQVRKMPAHGPF